MLSKVRVGDVGEAYAYRKMLAAGAPKRRPGEAADHYVRRALQEGPFQRVRPPGNFVYVYAAGDRREKRMYEAHFATGLPYPKADDYEYPPIRTLPQKKNF